MHSQSSIAVVCYESLLNDDATERSLRELLSEDRWDAVGNGVAAALIVVTGLSVGGSGAAFTTGLAALAVILGAMLHRLLLVAAVLVIRAHGRFARGSGRPA